MMPGQSGKTVAVLGGRGMLGRDVCTELRGRGYETVSLDLPEFDICVRDQVREALRGCGAVVNCAAYTHVDGAEREPERAASVNGMAPGVLGEEAARRDVFVIHIGTDFVFAGDGDRPYTEEDEPRPLNVYGATKLQGERALAASGCRQVTVRVQWTYGRHGNHFIGKVLARAEGGGPLKVVDDQVGSPTWTGDVAPVLADLLEARIEGLFHYAARGYASRREVACAVLEACGRDDLSVAPCRTADFPAPARRPLNSRFDCSRIDAVLRRARPHWRDALAHYLRNQSSTGSA